MIRGKLRFCSPTETQMSRSPSKRRVKTAPHVKEVEIPGPVHHYNRNMGGVDLNDQYHASERSGKKWGRFVFWFLVDVAVCNAYIVEGLSSHLPSSKSRQNHLQFKLEVAKQLIGGYSGSDTLVKRGRLHLLTMLSPKRTWPS